VGRRKAHHTHEIGDAYAEGWAARKRWLPGGIKPPNPYRLAIAAANKAKQTPARRETQQREVGQWDNGWEDCEEDIKRGDLAEVTDFDFRRLPKGL
jgi:hypothetical protein